MGTIPYRASGNGKRNLKKFYDMMIPMYVVKSLLTGNENLTKIYGLI